MPNDPTTLFVSTAGGGIGIGSSDPFGGTVPPLGILGLYRLGNVTGAPGSATATRIAISTTHPEGCFDTPCTGNRSVNDMVFYDPGDPSGNTLLLWQNGTSTAGDGGIWRSTNAMAATPSFTQSFITTAASSTDTVRGSLAIYREGANAAVVYTADGEPSSGTSCTQSFQEGAVRVSTDGGVTFGAKLAGGGGFCGGQCWYDIGLAVSPGATTAQTDDLVYLGGNVSSTTNCQRLAARSTNGGATFAESNGGIHSDTHAIKIAPSNANIIYRGDDGGIWKSTNAGVDWMSLNNISFKATQYQSLALHPTDANFSIGGTQDNGTIHYAPAQTWNRIDYGDGGFALIDQNAPDTSNVVMYHTYFNQTNNLLGFVRSDTVAGAFDNNWLFFGCDANISGNGIACTDAVIFFAPMALGPGNPNTVYFGSDRLYRSVNKGVDNVVVSQGPLVSGQAISDIAISPQDDNYRIVGLASVGAGVTDGALFFTTTGSPTLTSLDPTGIGSVIPDKYVARIIFDPTNKNTAYIALGGYMGSTTSANSHVWKVTNLGTTPVLTAINGSGITGLPDVPVNGLAIDPLKTTRLFAGTDIGVYDSEDGGATWSPFGLGLPRVAVFDMGVQNVKRVLRIATHGRGLWEIGLPTAAEVIVNPPTAVTATATSATNVQVNWMNGGTALSYQIWRSDHNGTFGQVGTSMGTTFSDTVLPSTTYLYKLKAVDGAANVSPFSNMDFATTVIFTNDPLVVRATTIQGVHLTEIRTAVNAMRAAAGLADTAFADSTVNSTLAVKAIHVNQARTALNEARGALGVPTLVFTNPTLTVNTSIVKAIDLQELRDGVK